MFEFGIIIGLLIGWQNLFLLEEELDRSDPTINNNVFMKYKLYSLP